SANAIAAIASGNSYPPLPISPFLKTHLPDDHGHLDHDGEREKAGKQSQHNSDAAEKFRPRGKIGHPARKAERAYELHMMMKTAEHLVITMRNHDRAQNKPHHKQSQRLQPIEKTHVYLQNQFSVLRSQVSGLRSQVSEKAELMQIDGQ